MDSDTIDEAAEMLTGEHADVGIVTLIAAYVALYGAPPPHVPSDAIEARLRALALAYDL